MSIHWIQALILAIALASNVPATAQEGDEGAPEKSAVAKSGKGDDQDKEKDEEKREPKTFTREFTGTFNNERLIYVVTAGETFLKNDKGENTASIFTTAYTKKDLGDPRTRPVTFVFNGGPGSASLWLHMGVFGPKRIVVPSDGRPAGAAPYAIEDNPLSLLDVTDLVFIDPVGTGYSTAMGKSKEADFWGLKEDANRSRRSSANGSPSTVAGTRPSTSPARVTARRVPRAWSRRCKAIGTVSPSTACC